MAALFDVESVHKATTPEGVGGGYEICFYDGKQFRKLDNFVIAKFYLDLDENEFEFASPIAYLCGRYVGRDLLLTSLIPDINTMIPFGTYARSPGFGRWHKPMQHQPFFDGINYATSTRISWRGKFVDDKYLIQTNIFEDDDRPVILKVERSDNRRSVSFTHPRRWVGEQLAIAQNNIREKYPEAVFGTNN